MLETSVAENREPGQGAETRSAFAVGERVQVEAFDTFLFAEPQPIIRVVQDDEGAFWYYFEGSNAAMPEADLRRVERAELAGASKREPLRAFLAAEGWGKLPDAVALDERVSDANLILIALRATGKNYDLPTVGLNMVVRGGGLGRNAVEDANREARHLGLLARWQPGGKPGEKFAYAEERLTFPEPGALRQRMVWRSWFGGILSRKELAALLYMRAKGRTLRRELEARFRWSSPTAKAALDGLASRRLIMVSATRTATGAFGPTFYETISPVPKDLETALAAKAASRAPDSAQPAKSHVKTPGHGTPGHGNPGHVLTPSEEDLSTPDLATLDLDSPPHTLLRKEDAISLTPPPAASVSEPEDLPTAKNRKNPKPIILRHWASAKFFAIRGIRPTGLNLDHAILDLPGWRALLDQHGGTPRQDHLRTPAAKTQAEALAGYLRRVSRGRLTEYLVLDALAQAVAAACRDGIEVRSLALIGIPMVTAVEKDDLSLVLDRPTRLDADRYAEVSALADEWAPRVAGNGYKVDAELLKSTRQVEELARLLDSYGSSTVVAGINWATDRFNARGTLAPRLPEGEVICGWGWFEPDIKAAMAEKQQHTATPSDQAAREARHREWQDEQTRRAEEAEQLTRMRKAVRMTVRNMAPSLFERLESAGVQCNREAMLDSPALGNLADQLVRCGVDESRIEEVMGWFVDEAIADRVDRLAGWRKTILHRALTEKVEAHRVESLWLELGPAIKAILAALGAEGLTCNVDTLTTLRSLQDVNRRGGQLLREPANLQLVIDACPEHGPAPGTEVKRWAQVHRIFTQAHRARKKLQQAGGASQ